ncbi:MAG: branched-chain amino acid ABC transporter permease [Anaerolineae bacterium]|nr:branched-chain amino acid ABC transporter permease [Anaerolineae bacterium]
MTTMLNSARRATWLWTGAAFALALLLPFFGFMDRYRTGVAVLAGIYLMLGLSLNLIVGYAGLFQLGHAAFYGLGAYTAAVLMLDYNVPFLLTIPIAACVAGLAAVIVSKPVLHLRGDYLCIVTIAFGEIFRIAVRNNVFGITGGPNGLTSIPRPEFPLYWVEPTPLVLLVIFLVWLVINDRTRDWLRLGASAAIIAAAYYLPPLLTHEPPLFAVSILMAVAALVVGGSLRTRERNPLPGIAAVAVIGALIVFVGGTTLADSIRGALDLHVTINEPAAGFLGLEAISLTFKSSPVPYYYLVVFFILVTIVGMRRLQNSRLGREWLYVRESQVAAEAMGINTTRAKLVAFALGSAWAGVAGVLYASRYRIIAPENFNFLQSVIMFSIVVLGGSGSIPGVFVGTLGMVVLPELLRDIFPQLLDWRDGLMGILMVLMMVLRPAGLIPERRGGRVFSAVAEAGSEDAPAPQPLAGGAQ